MVATDYKFLSCKDKASFLMHLLLLQPICSLFVPQLLQQSLPTTKGYSEKCGILVGTEHIRVMGSLASYADISSDQDQFKLTSAHATDR